jgi:site-specific DNA-methyltransferase (adenine-specific)
MNFQSNHRKEKHDKIKNDNNLDWLPTLMEELYRVSKDNTPQFFFCSHHYIEYFIIEIKKYFNFKNILVWEKNNTSMGDLNGNFASKTEFILFSTKGKILLNGKRDHNIVKFNRTQNKFHPTQKPVDLLEYLINKTTKENQTILDPFMGSGSTGVACVNTNREFIGIELDEKYYQIAKSRIDKSIKDKSSKLI